MKHKQVRTRRQRPMLGHPRTVLPASVVEAIAREVEFCAHRWNVSRSWVIANALADAFGVPIESYLPPAASRPVLRRVK